jgi:uncharacterized phiE125 gp8 family phage protein
MPLESLTEVKAALLITGSGDDALLARLLEAAEGFVADYTGRDFAGGTFTETHPAGRSVVFLRNYPVASVTSLKVDAARQFGAETARPADTFVLHAGRGVIESLTGPFLPPRPGVRDDWPGSVQVVYDTPTGPVPPAVRRACVELVGHWYRLAKTVRDQDYQMLTLRLEGGNQKDWPWSLATGHRLPPQVFELLAPYRVPPL